MKKLLALALMLALVISLASCDMLPESVTGALEGIKDSALGLLGGGEHTHEFVVTDSKDATCTEDGYVKSTCSCGETTEETTPATGHDMVRNGGKEPTCVDFGTLKYKCSVCGKNETVKADATGHNLVSDEPSRGAYCTNKKCPYFILQLATDGKYAEALKFTFSDADKDALEAKHNEMAAILEAAEDYDPAKHAYAEEGELADKYAAAEAVYEEYTDLIWAARDQYSIAMTLYYVNVDDEEYEATYNEMMEYYNGLVSKYYELSQPWADSMYREYFFAGMTDEEIDAYLFDSNALSDPEYTALKDRNDKIELEVIGLLPSTGGPITDDAICTLYAEFVENSNKMAVLLGYDNYLEYAYANVYDREYSPADVAQFTEYVKKYLVPVYNKLSLDWNTLTSTGLDTNTYAEYLAACSDSFFDQRKSNIILNDFIDKMGMEFTTNPDKLYSFSDSLNGLITDSNLFRGSYEGAYVSYIPNAGIPIAYFGAGYNNIFTVAHEFGHYMNEVYNESEYNQSYDLLEVHSQGHESLLLYYIESEKLFSDSALKVIYLQQIYQGNIGIIIRALQIDAFEQAIYLNSYDGYGAEEIMADGKITPDEYDTLYAYIATDFGIDAAYQSNDYWRYGMTVKSPCYYVSYSVSAVNALQIYLMAGTEGFDAAKDGYLKLISYTDVDPDMTMIEVLEYAGFSSYLEEDLYKALAAYLR